MIEYEISNDDIVDGKIPDVILKSLNLKGVTHLDLRNCSRLTTLPELSDDLKKLNLQGCSSLVALPVLPDKLKKLSLEGCSKLRTLPEIKGA